MLEPSAFFCYKRKVKLLLGRGCRIANESNIGSRSTNSGSDNSIEHIDDH